MIRQPQPGTIRNLRSTLRPASHGLRAVLTAVAGLAVGLIPARAQYAGGSTVRIEGRVYAERGQSIPSARVHLQSEEGDEIFSTALTPEGRYEISGLRRAIYRLTATADGYEAYQTTIDLTRTATHLIQDIVMSPKAAAPAGPPPSVTDASAPKAARKEFEKGSKALDAHQNAEAQAHFAKAVAAYPCYARAQTALAGFLIENHERAEAETALKKAIQCDAGFLSAHLTLGELYNAERKFAASIPILEDGSRRDPTLWKFHYQLGVAYHGAGDDVRAEEAYMRAEQLTPPAPPEVHVKLADVYTRERAYGKAYVEMQAYLGAAPNGPFAARVRAVMEQMESSGVVPRDPKAAVSAPTAKP